MSYQRFSDSRSFACTAWNFHALLNREYTHELSEHTRPSLRELHPAAQDA
jgi:hypothetical protein